MSTNDTAKPATGRRRKMAREPKLAVLDHMQPKRVSMSAQVLAMLERPDGARLDQLVAAAGWLPHTARAALTGLKKNGHPVTSDKPAGGVRIYRMDPTEATR